MSARQAAKSSQQKSTSRQRRPTSSGRRAKPNAAERAIELPEDVEAANDELACDDDEAQKTVIKEDPALDRRIIEGMLRDRKALLEELAKEGMPPAAVLRRAGELGLSEALLRQVKGVAADLAGERPGRRPMPTSLGARTCLSCDRVFLSTGPGNRLCMRCRGGDAGLAQF